MKYWIAKEIEFLKDNYKILSRKEIGVELGRTESSIHKKMWELGLKKCEPFPLWTVEEEEHLKDSHKKIPMSEIAEQLGRTQGSVHGKIDRLGIGFKNWWNDEKDNFLKENYKELTRTELADQLGRTKSSVINRVNRLGLKKGYQGLSGEKNPFYGRHHTEETKKKLRKYLHPKGKDSSAWKGKTKERECKYCGKPFKVPESWLKRGRGKFCSKECSWKWKSENIVGEKCGNWKGGYEPYYGPNWCAQRRITLERDNHICQRCGMTEDGNGRSLSVHHIIPFREFGIERYEEANKLENLISLCRICHTVVENNKTTCIPLERKDQPLSYQ